MDHSQECPPYPPLPPTEMPHGSHNVVYNVECFSFASYFYFSDIKDSAQYRTLFCCLPNILQSVVKHVQRLDLSSYITNGWSLASSRPVRSAPTSIKKESSIFLNDS